MKRSMTESTSSASMGMFGLTDRGLKVRLDEMLPFFLMFYAGPCQFLLHAFDF